MRVLRNLLAQSTSVLAVLGFLAVWQLTVVAFKIPPWLLPAPETIWHTFLGQAHLVGKHFGRTAIEAIAGLGIGAVAGIVLAVVMVHSPILERVLLALLVIDQSIPKLALAPLFVIWFGVGIKSKILITMLISFFPLIVNTARGLTAIDPRLNALMHTLSATKLQIFTKVRAPNAVPFVFTGLKIAVPLSIIGAVVGEFVQADAGLGFLVLIAVTEINTPMVFVAISLMALISLAVFGVLSIVERVTLWRRFSYMMQEAGGR